MMWSQRSRGDGGDDVARGVLEREALARERAALAKDRDALDGKHAGAVAVTEAQRAAREQLDTECTRFQARERALDWMQHDLLRASGTVEATLQQTLRAMSAPAIASTRWPRWFGRRVQDVWDTMKRLSAWQVVGVAYICQLVICSVLLLIYWNIESMAWRDVAATQVVIALVVKLTFAFELNKLCERVEYDLEDPVAVGYPVDEGYSVTMEDAVGDEALVTEENPAVKEDSEMSPQNEEP